MILHAVSTWVHKTQLGFLKNCLAIDIVASNIIAHQEMCKVILTKHDLGHS